MSTHSTHRPSAAQGLHTYGLAGIELQRKVERRAPGTSADASDRRPGLLHRMRQAAGDALIKVGTGIAGEADRPAAAPAIQPRVDLA